MRIRHAALFPLVLIACADNRDSGLDFAARVSGDCTGPSAEQFFVDQISDRAEAETLAKQLIGLGEPPLACGSRARAAYRLFARSFGGVWTTLRLEQTGTNELFLTLYRRDMPRMRRQLMRAESAALQRAVEQMQVWSRPQMPPQLLPAALDGSGWFLEVRSGDRYRLVRPNWSAEADEVRHAWRQLFELGGVKAPGEFRNE